MVALVGRFRSLAAAMGAVSCCVACPVAAQSARVVAAPSQVVPVERVVNEVRCDYLDFAYSDAARMRRLPVGRVTGTVTLSLARAGSAAANGPAALGVPVAADAIRLDAPVAASAYQRPVDNALTVPFAFDPQLALNPAAAGLDCSPAKRLARPVLAVAALAQAFARAGEGSDHAALRSPVRYQGQFFLTARGGGAPDVVPVRIDPARVGADAIFLQSFDVSMETGTPSWFADVGPGTAEPRPIAERRAANRVITVPRSPLARRAPAPAARRCIADSSGEEVCY